MALNIQLVTVRQTAQELDMPEDRVYDLVRAGVLPSVRFGRQVRIELNMLKAWIAAGGKGI
jgi:excisionase family DNA binding protein